VHDREDHGQLEGEVAQADPLVGTEWLAARLGEAGLVVADATSGSFSWIPDSRSCTGFAIPLTDYRIERKGFICFAPP
jgi:hypothetical protein